MRTTAAGSALALVRRYAPFLAMLGVLGLLLVAAPSRPVAGRTDSLAPEVGSGAGFGGDAGAAPQATATASASGTAQGRTSTRAGAAAAAGSRADGAVLPGGPQPVATGPLPCMPRPLNNALPCKPGWAGGDNGGVTAHNVGAKALTLVWYVPYVDATTRQIQANAGVAYSKQQIDDDTAALQKFARKYTQTYGRTVSLVTYYGQHQVTDDAGLKAEAVEIDQKLHAFAVAAAQMPVPMADELSRRRVVVFNTYQQTSAYYAGHAPYQYSVFGDADLLNSFTAEYVAKRLAGRKAQFGGTGTTDRTRLFGIAYEQVQEAAGRDLVARLKARGIDPVVATFGSDISQAQQQALNIVAQFKSAGVTTIVTIGNPFAPIFLTQNADTQQYYPEYLVTGYQQQDTEEAARVYSPTQWDHAFGFTQLGVRGPTEQAQGYRAARDADPSYTPSKNIIGEFLAFQQILNGIERSGPRLTPTAFQAALGGIPATAPTPDLPRLSYGSRGPGPYTARDDVAEVWWDATTTKTFDGKSGAYVRVAGGRRVQLGAFPTTVPAVFR